MSITSISYGDLHFNEQWICDEGWLKILTDHIPHLKTSINIDQGSTVKEIALLTVPFNSIRALIYHKTFKINCLFAASSQRPVHFFYRGTHWNPPKNPMQIVHLGAGVQFYVLQPQNAFQASCEQLDHEICDQ
jgi:hypothetical protein